MKKNTMMRVASALLVAVLLTTCAISGTFAKYVTTASGWDEARVAKWGVGITVAGTTFAETYGDTVASSVSDVNVVAPGTSGELSQITLSGTPEVALTVNYDATLTLSGWAVTGDDFYCPIVITIGSTEISGLGYNSASDFAYAVKTAVQAHTQSYGPNTDLSTVTGHNLTISWRWAFEGEGVINSYDTELGNEAAADNASTIRLDVTCTVTQVD